MAEVEVSRKPLPEGFYSATAWLESMVSFYCDEKQIMPRTVLQKPLKLLSRDIENVMILETNLPDLAFSFFNQVINPLFEPQEYRDKVYTALKGAAEEHNDQRYIILASSLLNMRCFFERNERFLMEHFSKEIEQVTANTLDDRLDKFGEVMQGITRAHVDQVAQMLAQRRE